MSDLVLALVALGYVLLGLEYLHSLSRSRPADPTLPP